MVEKLTGVIDRLRHCAHCGESEVTARLYGADDIDGMRVGEYICDTCLDEVQGVDRDPKEVLNG